MLLILHPFRFNNYYFKEYELDIYENKLNSNFEIHDLSNIINPNWGPAFKGKLHKDAKVFNSISEWKKRLQELQKKEKKITILNNLDINTFNSLIIHYLILKSGVNLIQYRSAGLPVIKEDVKLQINLNLLLKIIQSLIFNFYKIYFFLKVKLLSKLVFFLRFKKVYILQSGNKKNNKLLLNSKKNVYVNIHSKDYSKYLIQKKKKKNLILNKRYAVFLDSAGPYFENDKNLFGAKINHNVKEWYKDLNTYLKLIEKKFYLNVVIVPHPKVKAAKNPLYDKKFKVFRDLNGAAKAIPNSQFVICMGGTTAVSFAVANSKPIIFLYNDQILKNDRNNYLHSKNISNELDAALININKNINSKKNIKKINKKKYDQYKYSYLTTKKISKLMNYEIFNKII